MESDSREVKLYDDVRQFFGISKSFMPLKQYFYVINFRKFEFPFTNWDNFQTSILDFGVILFLSFSIIFSIS